MRIVDQARKYQLRHDVFDERGETLEEFRIQFALYTTLVRMKRKNSGTKQTWQLAQMFGIESRRRLWVL